MRDGKSDEGSSDTHSPPVIASSNRRILRPVQGSRHRKRKARRLQRQRSGGSLMLVWHRRTVCIVIYFPSVLLWIP
jgi:hypothetical protein